MPQLDINMSKSDYKVMVGHGFRRAGSLRVLVHRRVEVPLVDGSGLVIQRAARERWRADTGIAYGTARTHVWVLVQRGRLRLDHAAGATAVRAGELVAVPQAAAYGFWVDSPQDVELAIWNVTGTRAAAWWGDGGDRAPLVLRPGRRGELERCFEEMLAHLDAVDEGERRLALHYHALILDLLALDRGRPAATTSTADRHAERCRAMIDARALAIGNAAELATGLDLHPDYLARIYRARFGASPAEHLRRRRMVHACERLRAGEDLATIAETLGFADAFTFSKAFKTWCGLPPRRWRQQFGE